MHRGLLLLYICMPTYHSLYDEYLSEWIDIWLSVSNNAQWDGMWLAVFHRASKNVLKFNWATLIPAVASKCRQQLPMLAPDVALPAPQHLGTYARVKLGVSTIQQYAKMLVFLCGHGEQLEGKLSTSNTRIGRLDSSKILSIDPSSLKWDGCRTRA